LLNLNQIIITSRLREKKIMKILLSLILIYGLIYFAGCNEEALVTPSQTYPYIQHTAFSVNTSLWTPNDHTIKYTVTMQNVGTGTAEIIRTQLFYKKPSSTERATRYLLWLNSDSSKVQIPPGGSITYEVTDTVGYVDSVSYWNLSYNANTQKNAP
jgi:hypothetical protein